MQCVTLIVHASSKAALTDLFHEVEQVERFTMVDCEGYDESDLKGPFVSAVDRVVGFVPRVRIEIIVKDDAVDAVLEAVRAPEAGVAGLGVYWTTTLLAWGSL